MSWDLHSMAEHMRRMRQADERAALLRWSAAWKASAKKFYKIAIFRHTSNVIAAGYIDYHKEVAGEWKDRAEAAELDRDRWQLGYQQADKERMEERDKWISAEKRVAELEEVCNLVIDTWGQAPSPMTYNRIQAALNKD